MQEKFELFLARNGQEALDASRAMELDAVLMDYSMPVTDVEAALVAMRATASPAQLPVVIVTGEAARRLIALPRSTAPLAPNTRLRPLVTPPSPNQPPPAPTPTPTPRATSGSLRSCCPSTVVLASARPMLRLG